MTAKQTLMSASLAVLLAASTEPASAAPEDAISQPTGEARLPTDPEHLAESPRDTDLALPADIDAGGANRRPTPTGHAHWSIRVHANIYQGSGVPPGATACASTGCVPPKQVPLMPKRRSGTFEIGAGYSTDDGFLATARIANSNLFGTGKGLSLSTLISARRQEFLMRYDDPALFGSQLRLRGDLFANTKVHPGFTRSEAGGALTLSRTIAPHVDVFAGYKLVGVTVEPNDVMIAARATEPTEPFWRGGVVSALRAGIAYDDTDAPYLPMRGTRAGASIEVADRAIGSSIDYTRTDAWISHHRPLGPFTLHVGGTYRTISESAPMSERLHFDGSSDIRGYAPGAVGPKHPATGLPMGGDSMWTARGELEAPLAPSIGISAVGFLDAGGLSNRFGGEQAASAGFGLIWRSPIGPLRFDWAFPLGGDGKPRFVFGIGGMF